MNPFCAAVDWGTSRFRFWLLANDGAVLQEISTDEGLLHAREEGFSTVLETHLSRLGCDENLPVLICGMAGARQGWAEAGYIDVPADIHDVLGRCVRIPGTHRDIRILPGIAQRSDARPDIMRGEETQLLGLFNSGTMKSGKPGLVCIPGTHSKWVVANGANVSGFTTFLTGELYSVLWRHSVLKMSVEPTGTVNPEDPVFLASFNRAIEEPASFSAQLFSHRSSQLLGFTNLADGRAGISGSVIGLELAGAFATYGKPESITLLATGNLAELYASALGNCDVDVDVFDAEEAGRNGLYYAACNLWGRTTLRRMGKR